MSLPLIGNMPVWNLVIIGHWLSDFAGNICCLAYALVWYNDFWWSIVNMMR